MNKYYFAYGMNTNITEMTSRCPNAVSLGRCVLPNFELRFRYHADIDLVPGSEMEGVLWEITPECESALDRLEGYPYYYNKINVVLSDGSIAMAYIMNSKGPEEAPSVGYDNCLYEGYRVHGLDVDKLTTKIDSVIMNNNLEYEYESNKIQS
jgi:gamma-glutamylcyclotransferase (GGCT)/AIG2-like uncharacterized protein YtfP